MTKTRTCTECHNEKPETAEYFHQSGNGTGSFHSICKECRRAGVQLWKQQNPEKNRAQATRHTRRLRIEVLTAYSEGTPTCRCCGDTHIEFLTLDHVNEDGAQHRRDLSGGKPKNWAMRQVYVWARQNGYPDTLQVLCFNCNRAKHIYGECQHQKEQRGEVG